MTIATRLESDMNGWCPVSRHYQVDGGYIVVSVNQFFTATGVDVFLANELGGAISMTPIVHYDETLTHNEALERLGYTVVDNVVEEIVEQEPTQPEVTLDPILELLPPEIAQTILPNIET